MTTCADHGYDTNFIVTDNQVPRAVNNFSSHPSIITIKNKKKKKNDQSHSSGPVTFGGVLEGGAIGVCRGVCSGRVWNCGRGQGIWDWLWVSCQMAQCGGLLGLVS